MLRFVQVGYLQWCLAPAIALSPMGRSGLPLPKLLNPLSASSLVWAVWEPVSLGDYQSPSRSFIVMSFSLSKTLDALTFSEKLSYIAHLSLALKAHPWAAKKYSSLCSGLQQFFQLFSCFQSKPLKHREIWDEKKWRKKGQRKKYIKKAAAQNNMKSYS